LTIEAGTDTFSRNVGNYQSTPHNIPEERKHYLYSGGNLKSRKEIVLFSKTTRTTSR
jgi:hypothetical protein